MREVLYSLRIPSDVKSIWRWISELGRLPERSSWTNFLKVQRCLREVFKLDVPQPTVHRFKASVARRFERTNIAIVADLLRGPSLSIDETEVRLSKAKAHVWVFAGLNGAYYEYRESP